MGDTNGRIALVSTYAHLSRASMERMLKDAFPESEVDNFSVNEVVKRNRAWIPWNLWYVARECGREILRGEFSARHALFRTTYAFRRLRVAMQQYVHPGRHLFSFQMQSLYGAPMAGSLDHKGATTALVLGIVSIASFLLSLFCCITLPGVFCAPFAWAIGARAKREIEASRGAYGNISAAVTGPSSLAASCEKSAATSVCGGSQRSSVERRSVSRAAGMSSARLMGSLPA